MEYVFVVAGSDGDSGPKPEIFNLGCPTFQCDKIDKVPGGGLNRVASAGGNDWRHSNIMWRPSSGR